MLVMLDALILKRILAFLIEPDVDVLGVDTIKLEISGLIVEMGVDHIAFEFEVVLELADVLLIRHSSIIDGKSSNN